MLMKVMKINRLICLLFTMVMFSSCHELLNVKPEGQLSLDDIFSNESTTGAYMNSCYVGMPQYAFSYSAWASVPILLSDDSWQHYQSRCPTAYYGMSSNRVGCWLIADNVTWGKSSDPGSINNRTSWELFYGNIKKCNIFLSRIDNAVIPSEISREAWKAEIKTLRAYYYGELISRYGAVPLITDPIALGDDGKNLVRTPFKEVAEFVIAECNSAIAEPTFPWRTMLVEKVRMNKAVAAVIKSRAALFLASPLFNNGENHWDIAVKATEESLKACLANGYELYTTVKNSAIFGDNAFFEYGTSEFTFGPNPVDTESIWISGQTLNANAIIRVIGVPQNKSTRAGCCPTQELVDSYPMMDGSYVLDPQQPYLDAEHLQPNYADASSYDAAKPYANRDPRFYATIYHNEAPVRVGAKSLQIESFVGGKDGIRVLGDDKRTMTGYYNRKYVHPSSRTGNTSYRASFRLMRLAELYLNYAEALAESGDWAKAVEVIKPIRDRVNMPNIAPTSQAEAIAMIRNERRIELAFEEPRYNDNRRWTAPDQDMVYTKHLTGMWIVKKSNKVFEYNRVPIGQSFDVATGKILGTPVIRETYKKKYLLHPIETVEANNLKAITGVSWQNPGW